MMVATGTRLNKRLAGGAVTPSTYKGSVFGARSVYPTPIHGNTPGGLIDKIQQKDPASTTFGHPFGPEYRSTATRPHVEPKTGFNVINQVNPLKQNVPEIGPNQRGTFF